jgi:hypothetical protein
VPKHRWISADVHSHVSTTLGWSSGERISLTRPRRSISSRSLSGSVPMMLSVVGRGPPASTLEPPRDEALG